MIEIGDKLIAVIDHNILVFVIYDKSDNNRKFYVHLKEDINSKTVFYINENKEFYIGFIKLIKLIDPNFELKITYDKESIQLLENISYKLLNYIQSDNFNMFELKNILKLESNNISENDSKFWDIFPLYKKEKYFTFSGEDSLPFYKRSKTSFDKYILSRNLIKLEKLRIWLRDLNKTYEIIELLDLKYLNLSDIKLSSFPDFIANLDDLEILIMNNNQLTLVPEFIGKLINLKSLSMCYNNLTSLPDFIENLINLETLCIINNNLTSLPNSIGNITNLQSLSMSNNNLTILPDSIGKLINLIELSINNNNLTSLPNSIRNITNLQTLYLENNNLTLLPNSIKYLANLRVLNLENNNLTSRSTSIGHLKQIQRVYL